MLEIYFKYLSKIYTNEWVGKIKTHVKKVIWWINTWILWFWSSGWLNEGCLYISTQSYMMFSFNCKNYFRSISWVMNFFFEIYTYIYVFFFNQFTWTDIKSLTVSLDWTIETVNMNATNLRTKSINYRSIYIFLKAS